MRKKYVQLSLFDIYTDVLESIEENKPKGLTPDVIREIEEKILGITHNEISEHDLNGD